MNDQPLINPLISKDLHRIELDYMPDPETEYDEVHTFEFKAASIHWSLWLMVIPAFMLVIGQGIEFLIWLGHRKPITMKVRPPRFTIKFYKKLEYYYHTSNGPTEFVRHDIADHFMTIKDTGHYELVDRVKRKPIQSPVSPSVFINISAVELNLNKLENEINLICVMGGIDSRWVLSEVMPKILLGNLNSPNALRS